MKIIKALSVITCALLLHTNAQAGEILIDDFSTDQGPISDTVVGGENGYARDGTTLNQNYSQVNGGGILGNYRDIYVEEISSGVVDRDGTSLADDITEGVHVQVSNDRFSASLDNLVKGFVVVTYDGSNEVGSDWESGVDTDGLGGVDWSGTTSFNFEDISNDQIAPVQLIVWTNDSGDGVNFVKHVLDFETYGKIDGVFLYDAEISVDGFDGGKINWASVGAFQAIFNLDSAQNTDNSQISVDLSIGRAVAVPEPAALSMFGAGVLMLGFVGSRRRKQSVTPDYSIQ